MLKTGKYSRKPFNVDGIRVTEENIHEVAKWCQGDVRTHEETKGGETVISQYVKVRVQRPMGEKQTQAFVGDWVLYAGTGYKVYTDKAFNKSFEPARKLSYQEAQELGIRPPREPKPAASENVFQTPGN